MKKIKLKWYDIVIISVLALAFIFTFIPVNPWTMAVEPGSEAEQTYRFFSLLDCVIDALKGPSPMPQYLVFFVLFGVTTIACIVFTVFHLKLLFKISLFGASVCMMLTAVRGFASMLFSIIISVIYLTMLLAILIVEGFQNRREIREAAEEEKHKDDQDSSN